MGKHPSVQLPLVALVEGLRNAFRGGVNQEELDRSYTLCKQLMAAGDCDALVFERTIKLLNTAGRAKAEYELCEYVKAWAEARRSKHLFGDPAWLNRRYKKIIKRFDAFENG
jgi:hypothetical protein